MKITDRYKSARLGDAAFKWLAFSFAVFVLVLMTLIFLILFKESFQSIRTFGLGFLVSSEWNPVTLQFGALPAIYGTVVTSIIAIIIALPISLGIAIFLTEMAPKRLKGPIGVAIEMLAAIPSIIYGMWGLFIFAPFISEYISPFLIDRIPFTRSGIIGAVILGLGRALGETMAVTFIIGNAPNISLSLLDPATSISATLANEFTEADHDLYLSSLIELGLILFMITFVVLASAKLMISRFSYKGGRT
jgi:phosphate transport system permease protein